MSHRALASIAAAIFLACAPVVAIRPGGAAAPTLWRIRAKASQGVLLVGSMTQWRPRALERRGETFELNLDLPPGRYEYRLEVRDDTGARQVFPEGAERADDGFGGENLVLRIR